MVRSADDLLRLFWNGSRDCADRFQAAQTAALRLDMFAFIPAYAAFLIFAAKALESGGVRLARAAMAAVLAAALLDEAEGLILLPLVAAWDSPPALFDALFWTVRPKFALLGLAEAAIGVLLLRATWLGKVAGVVMAAGGLASLWMLFAAPRDPLMMQAHSLAWAALLAVALAAAIRPALVAARGPAAYHSSSHEPGTTP